MKYMYDDLYKADKGKRFVLTDKGKAECLCYRNKTVGEPVSEYEDEALGDEVKEGYLIEVDIPNWIEKEGYEVVYYSKSGHKIHAGNYIIFPEKEIAERYLKNYKRYPWMDNEPCIIPSVYEGRALKECRFVDGKRVFNSDWYYGTSALLVGDLVEGEIVDDLMDMLPPACMRSDCSQIGEPASSKEDEFGKLRYTYATFKQVDSDTWIYCGACFRGENIERGKEVAYA